MVEMYEKNEQIGGRARIFEKDGFRFDMGPSWYWMPDVFDRFFGDFGKNTNDYYDLIRLSPAYKVLFEDSSSIEIGDSIESINEIFEKEEPGSSKHLTTFLKEAEYNYRVAIKDLVYKPGISPLELITPQTVVKVNQFFTDISSTVRRRIKSEKLIKILEFPVLFLGAKPSNTPSFYSFMNYADFGLGTWYPKGGMVEIIKAMRDLALELGVTIRTNSSVDRIVTNDNRAIGIQVDGHLILSDYVLSGADYHHTETLLDPKLRSYSEKYWDKKVFAPSALLFYVGFDRKLDNINHHMLFFDTDFDKHAVEIYDKPQWPEDPLFYANFTSITDDSAPEGMESGFFLLPLAPNLEDNIENREKYFEIIIDRFEKHTKQTVRDNILFKESYCVNDFKKDYNSFKGNAYGMANTLRQTAFLRPGIKSKKVNGLFFSGQLTVPGPGVPPALISGKIAADQIVKYSKSNRHAITI